MDPSFSFVTSLQYQLKAALAQLAAFQSGKKYQDMQEAHRKEVRSLKQKEKQTQEELAQTRQDMVRARNHWFEVFEDLEKECQNQVKKLEKQLRAVLERTLKAERQRDEALDKVTHQRQKIYELETELEKERGKNLRLRSRLNHDHENSSLPSSRTLRRKKITNSREKTGRKPGHKGHVRKRQEPTALVLVLPAPQEVLDNPEFKKTSRRLKKQMVNIRLVLEVTEYQADVYYNAKTGEQVHAEFSPGLVNEVNYGGVSIKAFLFLLNNDCCTSIDKSCRFLSDLTGGKLRISKGMVSRLIREFADRTKQERKETFLELLQSPVLHTDCTNARAGGKNAYVFVAFLDLF